MADNSLSPDAAAAALSSPVEKETGPAVEYTAADESGDLPHRDIGHATGPARPAGWKYKSGPNFGLFKIPYYASPSVQLTMVAFVCFLCPGMFNALNGMGGGGKTDPTLADNMASTIKSPSLEFALLIILEHCALLYLCHLRFLWWYLCQQAWCQVDVGFWRYRILHLRYQLAGLCSRQCWGLQHFRRRFARSLCWSFMDCPRDDHDLLPRRGRQGEILCRLLGYL
jgi:hypothetical protein